MFNIGMTTKIKNLEKTGCTKLHIEQCLNDIHMHGLPHYTYFGKRVSKGTVPLYTKNGYYTLKFDECDGWARSVEIL